MNKKMKWTLLLLALGMALASRMQAASTQPYERDTGYVSVSK
jgi:hypothetical protein